MTLKDVAPFLGKIVEVIPNFYDGDDEIYSKYNLVGVADFISDTEFLHMGSGGYISLDCIDKIKLIEEVM